MRIQTLVFTTTSVSDPHLLNPDLVLESGSRFLRTKSFEIFAVEKFKFFSENATFLLLGLYVGLSSNRRSLQPKEHPAFQNKNFLTFSVLCGGLTGSGSVFETRTTTNNK
jgi:hypothetical protein